jgi:opacity protein-like surface antigen
MKKTVLILIALLCMVGITSAQGKFGASIQGAISLPLADFGDAYKMGFGGLATGTYSVSPSVDVVVTSGYLTYVSKASSDVTFSSIPILGGVRVYFGKDKFLPYVTALAGLYSCTAKVTLFGTSFTSTDSKFGFAGGAGCMYKFNAKTALDITVAYSSIATDTKATTFLNIGAGVHFAF